MAGLLITNQSKVSEFRQKWIDALRNDVASLVACTLEIHQAVNSNQIKIDSLMLDIQKATARIVLRLNMKEKDSQAIIVAMNNLREVIHAKVLSDFKQVNSKVNELEKATGIVLKKEWRRVKSGEFIYRWTFRTVVAGVLILVPVFLFEEYPQLLKILCHG